MRKSLAGKLKKWAAAAVREIDLLAHRLKRTDDGWPDFLVIGAQKCGTTTLYRLLGSHPAVAPARRKEVLYFSHYYQRGPKWYRNHFPRPAGVRSGEATPYYLFHPLAPGRLAADLPQCRLIVLLRDPAERALSHYQHSIRNGHEKLPLAAALEAEAGRLAGEEETLSRNPAYRSAAHQRFSYFSRGCYLEQLQRFSHFFDAGRILVLNSESFFADPQAGFDRVCSFLDLPCHHCGPVVPANRGNYRVAPAQRLALQDLRLRYAPLNEALFAFLGERFNWCETEPDESGEGEIER